MSKNISILHLEDSDRDAELVRATLEQWNASVRIVRVTREVEFRSALSGEQFEIILSDNRVPDFNGVRALEIARTAAPQTPFIFVSGTIGEERAVESLRNGAADYIMKDRMNRFLPAVERALNEAEERRAKERAEQALREREEQYRTLIENVKELIWEIDIAGRFQYCNPFVQRTLGYSPEEIRGKEASTFIDPEDLNAARKLWDDHRDGAVGWQNVVLRWRHKDGSVRMLESNGAAMFGPDGSHRGFRGVDRDITSRIQAQEKLREQELLLDVDPDAIIVRDLEHRIVFWSRGAELMYGWRKDEVLGRRVTELLAPRIMSRFEAASRTALESGTWLAEWPERTKDGKEIIVETRWTLVREKDGKPKFFYVVDTDITAKKELEYKFLRMQRLESLGTLAGGIAHDLNNVLGPIMIAAGVLRDKNLDPSSNGLLETLESSAARGARLVKQILSFARGTESEKVELQPSHLVREVVQIARGTFPKHIEVRQELSRGLWSILADSTQIHQVLMNLCVNARDAMHDGGTLTIGAENVMLSVEQVRDHAGANAGPHVMFSVADTGSGIAPEVQERMFEAFFTTKALGKGTGLGLSTTLSILRMHGGVLTVQTAPAAGSTFRVYLPATEGTATESVVIQKTDHHVDGLCILLVDDEEMLRETIKTSLESFGYRVLTAANGVEAVEVLKQRERDVALVVCDMQMPLMGGPKTISELRRIRSDLKVIAVSGDPESERKGDIHVSAFIPKPFTTEVLLQGIERALLKRG